MIKQPHYINYLTGMIYRENWGYVQVQMKNGVWRRSARFVVADLAHFPFIQVKARKVWGE